MLGGTRYFGRSIVQELLDQGHNVTVFTRGNNRPSILQNVNHIKGDRQDLSSFRKIFKEKTFDILIDNIGYLPNDIEATLDIFRGNIGLYIYTSSISAYRDQYLKSDILKEDDFHPIPGAITSLHSVDDYCVGKNQCEIRLMENDETPYVILRPPLVMGPDDHSLNLYFFLQRIMDGGPILLPGKARLNLRHVYEKDLASAYPKFFENKSYWNRAYNIAGKEVLSAQEYLGYIANKIGKELDIIYFSQSKLDEIEYTQPLELNRFNKNLQVFLDITRIQNDIEIKFTPFKDWMDETIDWYLNIFSGSDSKGYHKRQEEINLAKAN